MGLLVRHLIRHLVRDSDLLRDNVFELKVKSLLIANSRKLKIDYNPASFPFKHLAKRFKPLLIDHSDLFSPLKLMGTDGHCI